MGFNTKMYWRRVHKTAATAGILLGMLSASGAQAGETVSIKTPLGQTISAEKVSNPAKGTIEHQIIESLKMIRDGQFDAWRKAHCYPARCDTDIAWEQIKNFNLETSKKTAKFCLHEGDSIWVTKREENAKNPNVVKVFISCGETRMPVPSTHEKLKDKWYVQVFSW